MLVCFFTLHARLRVHWAPGFPCALYSGDGSQESEQNSRETRGEIAKLCLDAVIPGRLEEANYGAQLRT